MIIQNNKHYYSLDFFRGFCGYGVAICHLYAFVYQNIFMEYLSYLFVELFFVLSGFVLYPQLIKVLYKKKNLNIFYLRRWIRTLPLYFLMLILVSVLTNNFFSLDFFKYVFFIQKAAPNLIANDFYPVAWSLSIEEYFYLFFPIILLLLNKENYIKIIVFILFALILIKMFFAELVESNFYRTGTFLRLDAILVGFVIHHFIEKILVYKKPLIFGLIILMSLYLFNHQNFITYREEPILKITFILLLQAISSLTMLFFIFFENLFNNKKIKKLSVLISTQTYSIYLFHIILIYLIEKGNFSLIVSSSIYIPSLFVLSFLIYNYFEKPLLNLRPKMV